MSDRNASIGIFDSGVGGLTVLRALHRQLPEESILYFADTARLPYGGRTPQEILQFVREILTWMAPQVKMVIMACGTSSALALEAVRQEFPLPILGLILPGARAAVRQGRRIGVIATAATANSHAYRDAILEMDPEVSVWEVGCPEFVPLIEQNRLSDPLAVSAVRQYVDPLVRERRIDTLIYGCTHYPHLEPIVRTLLPAGVATIDPAVPVVAAAAQELDLLGLRSDRPLGTDPQHHTSFAVSGCPEQFAQVSRQWLGFLPQVEQVYLHPVPNPANLSG